MAESYHLAFLWNERRSGIVETLSVRKARASKSCMIMISVGGSPESISRIAISSGLYLPWLEVFQCSAHR